MRKALDLLTSVLVIVAVTAALSLSSAPDVEASLGIPACAGRPQAGACRYCTNPTNAKLPGVIDEHNVRSIQPGAGVTPCRSGF